MSASTGVVDIFTHLHIGLTSLLAGVICLALALWRTTGNGRVLISTAIGVIAGVTVYLWRASADVTPLNRDGLPGFSANDWLAPVVTFVALSVFADLLPPVHQRRFGQVRAAATLAVLAVNVITI